MRARQPQVTADSVRTLLALSTQDVAGATPVVESINACTAMSALLMTGLCPDTAAASVARDTQ
jgi:hypothetical protein